MSTLTRAAAGAPNLEPSNRLTDLLWQPSIAAIATPADQNGVNRSGELVQMFAAPVGAGTSSIQQMPGGSAMVAAFTGARRQTAIDRLGFTPHLDKYTGTRAPTLDLDPVCRLLFRIARIPGVASDPIDENFGVGFGMVATGNVGFFSVTQPGFGLVGDGAGGWRVWAKQAQGGLVTISQPILWPTVDTELTDWEWRINPATESASAVLRLFRQGEEVFKSFWSANKLSRYPSFPNGQRLSLVIGSGAFVTMTDSLAIQSLRLILSSAQPA